MTADNKASDDDSAARELLDRAGMAARERDPDVPATFAAQLYGRTVPEDLLRYGAVDLAMLAARAYALLQERDAGAPKIRCASVDLTDSGDRRSIGVVEIVNDDMPFLLDSVMGELAERRIVVRLVAHPVIGVERDGARLVAIGGPGAGARESFIHLHVDGLADEAACADLTKAIETHPRRGASRRRRLAAHARPRQRHCRRAQGQSAAAAGRRDRRSDPVPAMAARRQLHLPRRAQLQARGKASWCPISTTRSASCASANCACSAAATSCWR